MKDNLPELPARIVLASIAVVTARLERRRVGTAAGKELLDRLLPQTQAVLSGFEGLPQTQKEQTLRLVQLFDRYLNRAVQDFSIQELLDSLPDD